jgi:16S rRNA (guanine966-N2)-methyltransferase
LASVSSVGTITNQHPISIDSIPFHSTVLNCILLQVLCNHLLPELSYLSSSISAVMFAKRSRTVALMAIWGSFMLPGSTTGFLIPNSPSLPPRTTTALKVASGGTRKADAQDSTPAWKKKVEAKRDFLGHVVPKTSTTRKRRKIRPQGKLSEGHPQKKSTAPPLRILGGSFRNRKLWSPEVHLRPMMGKVREACFSTFTFFDLYKPPTSGASKALCRHLDIFAGSGSVGLESLSRGATHCTFVDLAQDCCDTIRANLELCGVQDQATVVKADAMEMLQDPVAALQKSGIPCSEHDHDLENTENPVLLPYQIVTLCPPYEEVIYGDLIDAVCNSRLVTDDTIVLIEYPIELGCLPHVYDLKSGGKMIGLRNRKYGRTVVAMYIVNPTGRLQNADIRPEEFVSL